MENSMDGLVSAIRRSHMLRLGRPAMEYICPYGHGTLNIEELKIAGAIPTCPPMLVCGGV